MRGWRDQDWFSEEMKESESVSKEECYHSIYNERLGGQLIKLVRGV